MKRFSFLLIIILFFGKAESSVSVSKAIELAKKNAVNKEYSKAKRQLINAIIANESTGDTTNLIRCLTIIEDIYSKLGQYDSAITICYRRLGLNKLQRNYKSLSDNFRALNTLLITNLESKAAEGLMDSCYHYALLSNDKNTIIVASTNYGSFKAGFDKADGLRFLNRAVAESVNCDNLTAYLYARVQAAEVLISVDSLDKAKEYLMQAQNKAIENNEKIQLTHIYLALARIRIKKQEIGEAISLLHSARNIAENEPCIYYLPDIYQTLSQAFRINNNVDSSFYYNDKFNQTQQTLVNEKTNIQVAEVNAKYQLEGKQNIIEKLRDQIGTYRTAILSIIILLILTICFFGLYIFNLSKSSKFFANNSTHKSARKKELDIPSSLQSDFNKIFIVQEVYSDPELTLKKLAELLNTNTTYLSRFINEEYKINFSQLLNQFRVEKVCMLMMDSKLDNIKIEALAQDAGFKSKSTFNIAFKKQKGLTPTQWRDKFN